ncbi:methyltransferase domain-containing protein [Phaeacidiphilus oryzae]|uniref:methyltransferase domain-containing protein n=1 Tax=Phaeacidiphilus oryzae TaxID=348818 RepID=UPI0005667399
MLPDVVERLACPHCGEALRGDPAAAGAGTLRCAGGRHSFDLARQGYVSLLRGDARLGTADTAEMVAAREEFQAAGHYAPIAEALAGAAALAGGGDRGERGERGDRSDFGDCVLDLGGGTGYYLAPVLDALPDGDACGIVLDASKYALRRAAKAHPRAGAVLADAWQRLPVRDASVSLVLNVFAPRNGAEIRRVLRPGGSLLVVTPGPGHLAELVGELGLIGVDDRKPERLAAALTPHLAPAGGQEAEFRMALDHRAVETVVRMGPSAWHTDPGELRQRIAGLDDPVTVTASVRIDRFRRLSAER